MPTKKIGYKYSCFISYRHGQGDLIKDFVEELMKALENRLGLKGMALKVFLDKERLNPSYSVTPGLAEAICQSVCMIVVYNNGYFDKGSPFCAKEFCAMAELEKKRLRDKKVPTKYGLIIPVLVRKPDRLPAEIFDRNPCDFSEIYTNPQKHHEVLVLKNELKQSALEIAYPKEIEKICEIIMDTYQLLTYIDNDPCSECGDFKFPTDDKVNRLLQKNSYTPDFPLGGS